MTVHEFITKNPAVGKLGLYRYYDDDIVVRSVRTNIKLSTEDIESEVRHMQHALGKESYHTIIELTMPLFASKDARSWLGTPFSNKTMKTYALVTSNPLYYFMAKRILKMKKLEMPLRSFRTFEQAKKWTEEQKEQMNTQVKQAA